jgi:hypothetical protein
VGKKEIHFYGPSALEALCGAKNVYCTNVRREINCPHCRGLLQAAPQGESARPRR